MAYDTEPLEGQLSIPVNMPNTSGGATTIAYPMLHPYCTYVPQEGEICAVIADSVDEEIQIAVPLYTGPYLLSRYVYNQNAPYIGFTIPKLNIWPNYTIGSFANTPAVFQGNVAFPTYVSRTNYANTTNTRDEDTFFTERESSRYIPNYGQHIMANGAVLVSAPIDTDHDYIRYDLDWSVTTSWSESEQTFTISPRGTQKVYYTTNGATPSDNSIEYTGPIPIESTTTVKFVLYDEKGLPSPKGSNSQTITYSGDTPPTDTLAEYDRDTLAPYLLLDNSYVWWGLRVDYEVDDKTNPTDPDTGTITITPTTKIKPMKIYYSTDGSYPSILYNSETGISLTDKVTLKFRCEVDTSLAPNHPGRVKSPIPYYSLEFLSINIPKFHVKYPVCDPRNIPTSGTSLGSAVKDQFTGVGYVLKSGGDATPETLEESADFTDTYDGTYLPDTVPEACYVGSYYYGMRYRKTDCVSILNSKWPAKATVAFDSDTKEITLTVPNAVSIYYGFDETGYFCPNEYTAPFTIGASTYLRVRGNGNGNGSGYSPVIYINYDGGSFETTYYLDSIAGAGSGIYETERVSSFPPPVADYFVSANGSGDGLTPASPASWEYVLGTNSTTGQATSGDFVYIAAGTYSPTSGSSNYLTVPTGVFAQGGYNSTFTEWDPSTHVTNIISTNQVRMIYLYGILSHVKIDASFDYEFVYSNGPTNTASRVYSFGGVLQNSIFNNISILEHQRPRVAIECNMVNCQLNINLQGTTEYPTYTKYVNVDMSQEQSGCEVNINAVSADVTDSSTSVNVGLELARSYNCVYNITATTGNAYGSQYIGYTTRNSTSRIRLGESYNCVYNITATTGNAGDYVSDPEDPPSPTDNIQGGLSYIDVNLDEGCSNTYNVTATSGLPGSGIGVYASNNSDSWCRVYHSVPRSSNTKLILTNGFNRYNITTNAAKRRSEITLYPGFANEFILETNVSSLASYMDYGAAVQMSMYSYGEQANQQFIDAVRASIPWAYMPDIEHDVSISEGYVGPGVSGHPFRNPTDGAHDDGVTIMGGNGFFGQNGGNGALNDPDDPYDVGGVGGDGVPINGYETPGNGGVGLYTSAPTENDGEQLGRFWERPPPPP